MAIISMPQFLVKLLSGGLSFSLLWTTCLYSPNLYTEAQMLDMMLFEDGDMGGKLGHEGAFLTKRLVLLEDEAGKSVSTHHLLPASLSLSYDGIIMKKGSHQIRKQLVLELPASKTMRNKVAVFFCFSCPIYRIFCYCISN